MKEYTQEELEDLIKCPKLISVPPKDDFEVQKGNRKNQMRLVSVDNERLFYAFMRQSEKFPENFSIGLNYRPKEQAEEVYLIRCNYKHGYSNDPINKETHFSFHIHWIQEQHLNSGIRKLRHKKSTDEYGTFQEAVMFFLKLVNVENFENYKY